MIVPKNVLKIREFNLDNSDQDLYILVMHVTKKHQYGLAAMVHLSFLFKTGPVQLRVISHKAGIPHAFLEQLILDLKKANLVKSTRGPKGGYQLVADPSTIAIKSVFCAIDPLQCQDTESHLAALFWDGFNRHVDQYLSMTLQSVMTDIIKKDEVLTYTI
jgi:Rrf2 family protein